MADRNGWNERGEDEKGKADEEKKGNPEGNKIMRRKETISVLNTDNLKN